MKEEERSNRKRKRPKHRQARTQKSSRNHKDTDDHQVQVSKKIDSDEEISKGASRSSAFLDKVLSLHTHIYELVIFVYVWINLLVHVLGRLSS